MMPPPRYTEELLRAKYHVQVEIEDRGEVDQTPAHIPVRCRVRRVFRGHDLHAGDVVQFSVAVCRAVSELFPGGETWMRNSDFQRAKYFEGFLYGTPPNCEVALSRIFIIRGISHWPRIAVPTEKELDAAWRYFNSGGHFGAPFALGNGPLWRLLRLWRRLRSVKTK